MIKIIHIAAVELFTAYTLFKVITLWLNKPSTDKRLLRITAQALAVAGLIAGFYMYMNYYHFYTPAWLTIKFCLIGVSITSGIAGSIKQNKWLLLLSFICNLAVIIIANIKFN